MLCSKNGSSAVLVFIEGSPTRVETFGLADDKTYLQDLGNDRIGYSRVIALADRESISGLSDGSGGKGPRRPDHDGIEDMFVDKASIVYYWQSGKWSKLFGGD